MSRIIRLATPFDGPALADIYRPHVEGSAVSFEIVAPDGAEMAARVLSTLAGTPWLVCVDSETGVLGYAYAARHRERPAYQWSADVSAYVRSDVHRGGVARALYTSLFAILALQGYRNAYAGITLPNPASEGMHAALGFTPVGVFRSTGFKLDRWHDVGWFERQILPWSFDPAPPVPLPRILGTAAFEEALAGGIANSEG
jgi:phosphinothricin acetyltransferase